MSNRRCAAKTCFNVQGCRPNLKFFPFPKDELTSHQWVINCGRTDLLDKTSEQLTKFLLCADHFESHWFLNPKYKTVFTRTGQPIPTIFHNNLHDFIPKALRKNVELRNYKQEAGDIGEQTVSLAVAEEVEISEEHESYLETDIKRRGCHKMCRLCACMVYEDQLISLFSEESVKECLPFKINRLLPDKIEEDDGLPHHVCNSCLIKLNECNQTVEAFITADRKLRDLFQASNPISHDFSCLKSEEESQKMVTLTSGDTVLPDSLSEFLTVRDSSGQLSPDHLRNGLISSDKKKIYIITKPRELNNHKDAIVDCVDSVLETVLEGSCESFDESAADCYPVEYISDIDIKEEQSGWLTNEHKTYGTHFKGTSEGGIKVLRGSEGGTKVTEEHSKPYLCTVCGKTFRGKHKLLIHEINQHACENASGTPSPKRYKKRETHTCNECGLSFNGLKPLKRHIREYHIPAENICEFCGAHYKIKSQLEVHRRLHTDEKPFSCAVCNESFHFKKALKRHKRIHAEPKSLTCTVCNKTFSNRTAKWRHQKIHSSSRNMLCYLCGKVLSNSQSLRVHMRTHSSDRPCSCPTCGKTFKDNISVTKHMIIHSAEKNFKCDICGRAFYSKGLVTQHKLSHSGVKPHRCETCGAAFNRLGNLNQHKKKHTQDGGNSPKERQKLSYECVVCGKWMKSELTLKYHLAKHTGEKKPFDCEVCGKRFIAVDPYRVHMRIHTGERPYECDMCEKTFRSAFTLKQHAALHRDEYPYSCPFCERRFKRLQSLMVHKRTHTGEKPHPCPVCGRGFAQKGDMIKHTRTHGRDRERANTPVVMELEHITELVLSDTEITSEFLIDMPIVEVETEMQPGINSEIQSEIKLDIQPDINSVIQSGL